MRKAEKAGKIREKWLPSGRRFVSLFISFSLFLPLRRTENDFIHYSSQCDAVLTASADECCKDNAA